MTNPYFMTRPSVRSIEILDIISPMLVTQSAAQDQGVRFQITSGVGRIPYKWLYLCMRSFSFPISLSEMREGYEKAPENHCFREISVTRVFCAPFTDA
jgi:hypothetical protein